MKIYYKNGFYIKGVNRNIPMDAVEIDEMYYDELLRGQEYEGLEIVPDQDGYPVSRPPVLSDEQRAQNARAQRDKLLADTDYVVMPDYPISADTRVEWEAYRQALRDITNQPGFPDSIIWPEKP